MKQAELAEPMLIYYGCGARFNLYKKYEEYQILHFPKLPYKAWEM